MRETTKEAYRVARVVREVARDCNIRETKEGDDFKMEDVINSVM